jgi:hypothetical protein
LIVYVQVVLLPLVEQLSALCWVVIIDIFYF